MAQQLWLIRHGDAEPHGARHDADRRLTAKGEKQARMAGEALARLGLEFAAVYTSPRVRARDTAHLVAEALKADPVIHQPLSAGFDADEARALLAAAGDGARVLLVGHEPDFSQTVHDLTGARIDLKKGGIAGVRVDGSAAELIDLLRPREVEEIVA
jgi:phosphohistidine phosphatase